MTRSQTGAPDSNLVTVAWGFMFPVSNMPEPFQWMTLLNPLRHYLEVVRGVFLKGAGADALWRQLLSLAALGAGLLWLATARFRRQTG